MMTRSFAGKVAAITGAASGMGRSLAVALAQRGCHLALSDVDVDGLAATAAMLTGVRVTTQRLDVANAADILAWSAQVLGEHQQINLLFNNAGVSYGATVQGAETSDFQRILDIDFWGVVHGTRAFLPHLEASGDGHVINTSSLFGLIAFPGQSVYNSAKFAVRGFTEALCIELEMSQSPVRATCVHPGGIKTNIARASKVHPSLAALGVDLEHASADFERAFRVTADEAAATILRGVQRNERRVLIGADARWLDRLQRLLPNDYHGLVARVGTRVLAHGRRRNARAM